MMEINQRQQRQIGYSFPVSVEVNKIFEGVKSFWRVGLTLAIIVQEYRGPIVDLQSENFIEIIGTNPQNNITAPHLFLSSQKLFEMIILQEANAMSVSKIIEGSQYCHDLIVKNLLYRMLIIPGPKDTSNFEIGLQLCPNENLLSNGQLYFQISRPKVMGITTEAVAMAEMRREVSAGDQKNTLNCKERSNSLKNETAGVDRVCEMTVSSKKMMDQKIKKYVHIRSPLSSMKFKNMVKKLIRNGSLKREFDKKFQINKNVDEVTQQNEITVTSRISDSSTKFISKQKQNQKEIQIRFHNFDNKSEFEKEKNKEKKGDEIEEKKFSCSAWIPSERSFSENPSEEKISKKILNQLYIMNEEKFDNNESEHKNQITDEKHIDTKDSWGNSHNLICSSSLISTSKFALPTPCITNMNPSPFPPSPPIFITTSASSLCHVSTSPLPLSQPFVLDSSKNQNTHTSPYLRRQSFSSRECSPPYPKSRSSTTTEEYSSLSLSPRRPSSYSLKEHSSSNLKELREYSPTRDTQSMKDSCANSLTQNSSAVSVSRRNKIYHKEAPHVPSLLLGNPLTHDLSNSSSNARTHFPPTASSRIRTSHLTQISYHSDNESVDSNIDNNLNIDRSAKRNSIASISNNYHGKNILDSDPSSGPSSCPGSTSGFCLKGISEIGNYNGKLTQNSDMMTRKYSSILSTGPILTSTSILSSPSVVHSNYDIDNKYGSYYDIFYETSDSKNLAEKDSEEKRQGDKGKNSYENENNYKNESKNKDDNDHESFNCNNNLYDNSNNNEIKTFNNFDDDDNDDIKTESEDKIVEIKRYTSPSRILNKVALIAPSPCTRPSPSSFRRNTTNMKNLHYDVDNVDGSGIRHYNLDTVEGRDIRRRSPTRSISLQSPSSLKSYPIALTDFPKEQRNKNDESDIEKDRERGRDYFDSSTISLKSPTSLKESFHRNTEITSKNPKKFEDPLFYKEFPPSARREYSSLSPVRTFRSISLKSPTTPLFCPMKKINCDIDDDMTANSETKICWDSDGYQSSPSSPILSSPLPSLLSSELPIIHPKKFHADLLPFPLSPRNKINCYIRHNDKK